MGTVVFFETPMNREAYNYAPFYCEENIWHLCQEAEFRAYDRSVVLISNPRSTCALWHQRARRAENEPVLWDYHVIMLFKKKGWKVFDLDTLLPTPTPVVEYLRGTFGELAVPDEFRPLFRVIDADEFVKVFSSDRSHMKNPDGSWHVPPPPWPAIERNERSNLMDLIDMEKKNVGQVMDLFQLEVAFTTDF